MALLKSFKSKGFCRETFNWQYYYYYLTNEGIEYLRTYLALPAEIVPATLKVTRLSFDKFERHVFDILKSESFNIDLFCMLRLPHSPHLPEDLKETERRVLAPVESSTLSSRGVDLAEAVETDTERRQLLKRLYRFIPLY